MASFVKLILIWGLWRKPDSMKWVIQMLNYFSLTEYCCLDANWVSYNIQSSDHSPPSLLCEYKERTLFWFILILTLLPKWNNWVEST